MKSNRRWHVTSQRQMEISYCITQLLHILVVNQEDMVIFVICKIMTCVHGDVESSKWWLIIAMHEFFVSHFQSVMHIENLWCVVGSGMWCQENMWKVSIESLMFNTSHKWFLRHKKSFDKCWTPIILRGVWINILLNHLITIHTINKNYLTTTMNERMKQSKDHITHEH